ncbi:hypothetical protein RUM43_007091 [Polyplax serrata]|uniref:Uncharacterized protein n=1 Tax=Polyplax serrata TaxID=468196 RepID=A0AAN8S7N0_POLSC
MKKKPRRKGPENRIYVTKAFVRYTKTRNSSKWRDSSFGLLVFPSDIANISTTAMETAGSCCGIGDLFGFEISHGSVLLSTWTVDVGQQRATLKKRFSTL